MEFRPIPDYPTYGISQEGRVIRLRDHRVMAVNEGRVELWKDNIRKRFSIRILLAIVWNTQLATKTGGVRPTADIRRAIAKIDRMVTKNNRLCDIFEKRFIAGWEEGVRISTIYEDYNKHQWTDVYDNDRWQITQDGLLWDKKLHRFKTPTVNGGYKRITSYLSLHRALKLTFDFIPDYKDYHVHHKDGNKLNNNLDNLEWLKASIHNKLTAQYENAIPVVSKCLTTGETKVHSSIADCERHIDGRKNNCIKLRGKNSTYYKGYLIKRYQ